MLRLDPTFVLLAADDALVWKMQGTSRMSRWQLASFVLTVGYLGGSCGASNQQGADDRDADVADSPLAHEAADILAPEANIDDVPRSGKVTCDEHPVEGQSCDPLPSGLFCRFESCTGGCLPECRCNEGIWRCSTSCRDYFSPVPIDCGTPPLCREECLEVAVLPDGGLASIDGTITIGYQYALRFTPADFTTLWGAQPLLVAVGNGPTIDRAWLDDLASRVSLRTWPELETVPSTATVEVAASAGETARVTVTPATTLSERWYALHLSGLPFWATAQSHTMADGAYVARFSIGSDPRVSSVTFAGGPSKHRLYLALSESVLASVSPAQLVQVRDAGATVACTDVSFTASTPLDTLPFDCPTLGEFPDEIAVGSGLVSTTGVPLVPLVLEKADLTLSSCGTSCEAAGPP